MEGGEFCNEKVEPGRGKKKDEGGRNLKKANIGKSERNSNLIKNYASPFQIFMELKPMNEYKMCSKSN